MIWNKTTILKFKIDNSTLLPEILASRAGFWDAQSEINSKTSTKKQLHEVSMYNLQLERRWVWLSVKGLNK